MMNDELLNKAIHTYGKEAQTDMMIEEMSELTKALLKYRRNPNGEKVLDDIKEEMADVQIMLDQMIIIYGDIGKQRNCKLKRLAYRLETRQTKVS